MSESTHDNESGSTPDDDQGLVGDEQLPDDLRPDKNPMAADPDDDPEGEVAPGGQPAGAAPDQGGPEPGGPDVAQPG